MECLHSSLPKLAKRNGSTRMKKKKLIGSEAFDIYYEKQYGERWPALKDALLAESRQVAYDDNLLKPYYLDYASVQAGLALPPLESGDCLDMCAAPGGKTLVLSNTMSKDVNITANEISADRRNRLVKVLNEYLKPESRERIRVSGYDAAKMPRYEKDVYDRILLDAPCSSERHVLQQEKYLKQWTENRIKSLAQRQWSLLSAAFLLLKNSGFLVYSTCALSSQENDELIARLIKKYKEEVEIISASCADGAEKTKYGNIFLPDKAKGAGPIYFCLVKKSERK